MLWFRWPLALVGGLMAVIGGFWTWMLFLGSLGSQSQDPALDERHVTAPGTILATLGDREFEGEPWQNVRYVFEG